MTRRSIRIALLAALGGATLGFAATAPAATAASLPLSYDLGIVMPGSSASVTRGFDVPLRSTVAEATFGAHDSDASWTADLCDSGGRCRAVDALAGTTLDAGDYHLVVAVSMPADADGAVSAASSGTITLVQAAATGGLAATGGTVPIAAAAVGAILAGGGAMLLIGARRRRDREEASA